MRILTFLFSQEGAFSHLKYQEKKYFNMGKNKLGHCAVAKINKLWRWLVEMPEKERRERIGRAKASRKSVSSVQE